MRDHAFVSATTGVMVTTPEVPKTVKESGDMMKTLRSQCKGTEHTVSLILSNSLGRKTMCGLAVFVAITRLEHGRAITCSKTPRGCLHWRVTCMCEWYVGTRTCGIGASLWE